MGFRVWAKVTRSVIVVERWMKWRKTQTQTIRLHKSHRSQENVWNPIIQVHGRVRVGNDHTEQNSMDDESMYGVKQMMNLSGTKANNQWINAL